MWFRQLILFILLTASCTSEGLAKDARAQDIVDLRQLQTIAAPIRTTKLSPEAEAMYRVVSRRDLAENLISLIKGRRQLGQFEPVSWNAIDLNVCRTAGLGVERCVSLICLVPSIDPDTAKECPPATDLPNAKRPPDDLKKLNEWLESLGRSDDQNRSTKAQLLRRELPIESELITAKGALHTIWPEILEAANKLSELTPETIGVFVREVSIRTGNRMQRAAEIIAAARILQKLPAEVRQFAEPSGSQLITIASKIEPHFKDVDPSKPSSFVLSNNFDADLRRGEELIAIVGKEATASIVDFTTKSKPSGKQITDGEKDSCGLEGPSKLHQLSERKLGGRTLGLAFKALDGGSTDFASAELVFTLSAEANVSVTPTFVGRDGKPIAAQTLDVPAACALYIFPLGITVNNLVRQDGKLLHKADTKTLTQNTNVDRFRAGLDEFLQQVGLRGTPRTIVVDRPRIAFSADFKTVDLLFDVVVPILNVTIPSSISLIQGGTLVLEPSVRKIFNADELPNKIGQAIASSLDRRKISIGAFEAKILKVKAAPEALFDGGTWIALEAELRFGNTMLADSIDIYVTENNGTARFILAQDLTPVMRTALDNVLKNKINQEGIRSTLQTILPEAQALVGAVADGLLIERVSISDKGVVVKLGFDLAALTGEAGLPKTVHEGLLDPQKPDLGISALYTELIKKAMKSTANMSAVIISKLGEKLGLMGQDAATKAISEAIRSISQAAKSTLGIEITFQSGRSPQEGVLTITWTNGEKVELRNVAIVVSPKPRIDFSNVDLSEADSRRLGLKLQSAILDQLKAAVGVSWASCGHPRVARSNSGIIFELSAQTSILGCLPLPGVVYDGTRIELNVDRTLESITPIIVEKIKLLLPEDYRNFVTEASLERKGSPKLKMLVNAPLPGTSADLKAEVEVGLSDGRVTITPKVSEMIFGQILQSAAGLLGSGFKLEPVSGKLAVRASANVDFGAFGVGVRGMEVSPKRIYLPELLIKLPAAIAIGPFTVFPIQIQAKLEKPVHVALIGDVSFAALEAIIRIRATMGFEVPPSSIDMRGLMTLLQVLDLFEVNGKVDFKENRATSESKTVGILAAILPAKQYMEIDSKHASFESSMTLLVIEVKGNGEIRFIRNPEIEVNGSAKLAGLANLKANLKSDLELRQPAASIEGGISLQPLGDIKFGAVASARSAVLRAGILGINASLVVPSYADLNGDIIRKLFEALLKPSIDLKNLNLKNVKITLSPKVGGSGSAAAPGGRKEGEGESGASGAGATSAGASPSPKGSERQVTDPASAVRWGNIPSDWQSGWLPSSDGGMFCEAEWRSPREIRWLSSIRTPGQVVTQLTNPARAWIRLGISDAEVTYWSNCNDKVETRSGTTALAFFDGTDLPKVWSEGTRQVDVASWIVDVLKFFEAPAPAQITSNNMLAGAATAISLIYQEGLTANIPAALKKVKLADGRFMYLVRGGERVHLIDTTDGITSVRSFRAADVVGQWISQVVELNDKPSAKLRETLLPLLFVGPEPRALFQNEDRLLLLVSPFGEREPFTASFRLSDGFCGAQINTSELRNFPLDHKIGDPIAKALLSEGATCAPSSRWTELFYVVDQGILQRVVAARIRDGGDWAVDFVDSSGTPPCLRTGLTGSKLSALLDKWISEDAISLQKKSELVGSTSGLQPIQRSILKPEIAWGEYFPLNPFLMSVCEVKQ